MGGWRTTKGRKSSKKKTGGIGGYGRRNDFIKTVDDKPKKKKKGLGLHSYIYEAGYTGPGMTRK